ncbi:MAG: sulfatase-like hydrolase/transferase, partial [Candidatus Hydrogenedentes bacterium]|nr:sulfatase-like hydrolase/transferase [Candidatus Hydrogenedentota bacterium]
MHTRSFFRRFGIAVFAAAAGLGAMSCGGRETPLPDAPRPNIVVITVDTLRADHMSLYGYERETTPEIAAWFSGSTVYERAYSTTSYTPPSIVSVLTGLYPHN